MGRDSAAKRERVDQKLKSSSLPTTAATRETGEKHARREDGWETFSHLLPVFREGGWLSRPELRDEGQPDAAGYAHSVSQSVQERKKRYLAPSRHSLSPSLLAHTYSLARPIFPCDIIEVP